MPVHRVLYEPSEQMRRDSNMQAFIDWLRETRGLEFAGYADLHAWSVGKLEDFWTAVWEYFGVHAHAPYTSVLSGTTMPDVRWFEGALVSYPEHCLRHDPEGLAVIAFSQTRERQTLTFEELAEQVRRARSGLRRLGVQRGDRVVAYLPNTPEAAVAFLAATSLGAVWASCAPEFGARAVIDRFEQLDPTVLLVVGGYRFGEKRIDKTADVAALRAALPTLERVVGVPYGESDVEADLTWDQLLAGDEEPLSFEPVPFDHPLCVLFSSGTTGRPKPIVHGHGGILLEHLKTAIASDVRAGDRQLWFTTTAWMMWNTLISSFLHGATAVMVDGSPIHPSGDALWAVAEESGATRMGVSPGFVMASRDAGLEPTRDHDLSRIGQLTVAGSPLSREGFEWLHRQFGPDVLLNVGSGGTDVCSGIVQGSPLQPVWDGEMSGPALGVDAQAFDEDGNRVIGEPGELVICKPMPSMPIGFWGDTDGRRYRESYFDVYPGVWRHGDWVQFSPEGSCVITGRSDATLNRGGVRLGTAEFYNVVEELPGVTDSLVVHLEDGVGGPGTLILFLSAGEGDERVDQDQITSRVVAALRSELTPRHVPDHIEFVPVIPRNKTGKKLEVPVKRILQGRDAAERAVLASIDDPRQLDPYVDFARRMRQPLGTATARRDFASTTTEGHK